MAECSVDALYTYTSNSNGSNSIVHGIARHLRQPEAKGSQEDPTNSSTVLQQYCYGHGISPTKNYMDIYTTIKHRNKWGQIHVCELQTESLCVRSCACVCEMAISKLGNEIGTQQF